jgi:hypothetical protein
MIDKNIDMASSTRHSTNIIVNLVRDLEGLDSEQELSYSVSNNDISNIIINDISYFASISSEENKLTVSRSDDSKKATTILKEDQVKYFSFIEFDWDNEDKYLVQ